MNNISKKDFKKSILPTYQEIKKENAKASVSISVELRETEYEEINKINSHSNLKNKNSTNYKIEKKYFNDLGIKNRLKNNTVKINKEAGISYNIPENYLIDIAKYFNFEKKYLQYIKEEHREAFTNLLVATNFKLELIVNLNYLKGILNEPKLNNEEIKKINNINTFNLNNQEYFNLLLQTGIIDMNKLFQLIIIHEQRNSTLSDSLEKNKVVIRSLADLHNINNNVDLNKFKKLGIFGCTYSIQKNRLEYGINTLKDNEGIYLLTGYRRCYPLELVELNIFSKITYDIIKLYYENSCKEVVPKYFEKKVEFADFLMPNYFEKPIDFVDFLNNTIIDCPLPDSIIVNFSKNTEEILKTINIMTTEEKIKLSKVIIEENNMKVGQPLISLINRDSLNEVATKLSKALSKNYKISTDDGEEVKINKDEKNAEDFLKNLPEDVSNIDQAELLKNILYTNELNFFKLASHELNLDTDKIEIAYSNKTTKTRGVVRSNTQDTLKALYDRIDDNFNKILFISNDRFVAQQQNAVLDVLLEKIPDIEEFNKKFSNINTIGNNAHNYNYFSMTASNIKLLNVINRIFNKKHLDIHLFSKDNVIFLNKIKNPDDAYLEGKNKVNNSQKVINNL